MIYWHYTNGTRLWGILAEHSICPYRHDFERPNIYLTKSPAWDMAASRSGSGDTNDGSLTAEEMAALYGGIYRIGIEDSEVPLLYWPELPRAGGMPEWVIGLYNGCTTSNTADWAGTFEAIPARHWHHIERGDATGKLWTPLDGAALVEAIRTGLESALYQARRTKAEIESRMRDTESPERRTRISGSAFIGLPPAVSRLGQLTHQNRETLLAHGDLPAKPLSPIRGCSEYFSPESIIRGMWQMGSKWDDVAGRLSEVLPLPDSQIHGYEHARRVGLFAEMLARTYGADPLFAVVAAYCHDCGRLNDGEDPEHGKRSWQRCADSVSRLFTGAPLDQLRVAIEEHPLGMTSDVPLIAALWDADRVDLMRLGYKLESRFFSDSRAMKLAETLRVVDFWG